MAKTNLKIFIWDIETSLMQVNMFQMQRKYKNFIPHYQIKKDWHIICTCWKELGKSGVHSSSLLDNQKAFEEDPTNDYHVVKATADMIREADILIAHNGDQFDVKNLNTRLIYHGLTPLPKVITVDTLKEAKKIAHFSSNSLNYLADFFKVGSKMKTDLSLWEKCLENDEKAIDKMTRYCKGDVRVLERVYLKLRPYMKKHPNLSDVETENCTKCNSSNTIKHKSRMTANGIYKHQRQCNDCGHYFTLRVSEKSKSKVIN